MLCIAPARKNSVRQGTDNLWYAMLEDCGQGSFIQEALVKKIHMARKTKINFKAENGGISKLSVALNELHMN